MIPAKNQAVSAPPASPQPSSSQSDTMMGAPELLNDAKFKSAYYRAWSEGQRELASQARRSRPFGKKIKVAGTEYLFASFCKNRDCEDNNAVLLYSAQNGTVYGKILDRRRASLSVPRPSRSRPNWIECG